MSTRYPGGVITKTPVVPAGPYETGAAPGIWTLDQQLQAQKAGIWPIAGNAVPYIEDVFSTYLYTGNGSTQTITNGIDLSGKGGLVWLKNRSTSGNNYVFDTSLGATKLLTTNTTDALGTVASSLTSFNSNGFSLGSFSGTNASPTQIASWTFREQSKFFDIVTYTGNGSSPRAIAHNLGSTPGCMIVKNTGVAGAWFVYHRSANAPGYTAAESYLNLNNTNAVTDNASIWGNTAPTSTQFTVSTQLNQSADTYVAYLFAHDAGGFGLTGTDNVISCGSTTGGGGTVNLGYEPQWLLMKKTNGAQNWFLMDNMRGLNANQGDQALSPNLSSAEPTASSNINITSTGFINVGLGSISDTYIYIAIRRGPMEVPTVGTTVFAPLASRSSGSTQAAPLFNAGWPVDLLMQGFKSGSANAQMVIPRLTNNILRTSTTGAETNGLTGYDFGGMLGVLSVGGADNTDATICGWNFRRAPGFFDVVCYTGTGANRTVTHNLAAVPEMMIVKMRSSAGYNWFVYHSALGNSSGINLNSTNGSAGYGTALWNSTTPTSTVFSLGTNSNINNTSDTFVNYLFATCPGVSKVGSYTGNGTTQTVNCGFTTGARFVLIKRTDTTGDWYVYDTARGMTVLTDPYLLLNTTAAEVATLGSVTTVSTGFALNSTILAAINVSAGTYIFLAIA